jgi:hypothetical protein
MLFGTLVSLIVAEGEFILVVIVQLSPPPEVELANDPRLFFSRSNNKLKYECLYNFPLDNAAATEGDCGGVPDREGAGEEGNKENGPLLSSSRTLRSKKPIRDNPKSVNFK